MRVGLAVGVASGRAFEGLGVPLRVELGVPLRVELGVPLCVELGVPLCVELGVNGGFCGSHEKPRLDEQPLSEMTAALTPSESEAQLKPVSWLFCCSGMGLWEVERSSTRRMAGGTRRGERLM